MKQSEATKIYWQKVGIILEDIEHYAHAYRTYQEFKNQDLHNNVHASKVQNLATQRFRQALEAIHDLNSYYALNGLDEISDKRSFIKFLANKKHQVFFKRRIKEYENQDKIVSLATILKECQ